jgi:hypothetical protein
VIGRAGAMLDGIALGEWIHGGDVELGYQGVYVRGQGRLDVAELGCGPGEAKAYGDSAEGGEVSELHHLSPSQ